MPRFRSDVHFFAPVMVLMAMISQAAAQDQPIPNTQREEIPFTPAKDALEMLRLPEGFHATLFAAEPDVHQPIAVTTDHRGRLWVVECYTYSDRKTNYDMSLNDRVVIYEDRNNDGRFDKRTIFWDQGKKLTGIEVGYGGVWLTAAPEFLFIPDADRDDKPDGPPQVLLNGFEDNTIRHNIVNGLRWGPEGWLYGRHGIQATSHIGKPEATPSQRVPMNCGIWRYHPIHHKFEKVAEGGTNPWGFDYDEHGEMFMINTVIGHLFHVVQGARFRRMYGSHFNPNTYQVIEQTADHFHWDTGEAHTAVTSKAGMSSGTDAAGGGHAHTGLMIYQGGNWPKKYHNTLFTANFHGRRLNNDTIHRKGNSYVGRHAVDFMKTDDPWFRGVEMIYGPDGCVYLLDWSDIGECHENDGIHRTSGRIFKIGYGAIEKPRFDFDKASTDELIQYALSDQNKWFARTASRLLIENAIANPGAFTEVQVSMLRTLVTNSQSGKSIPGRLQGMWLLYAIGQADESFLLECTNDPDEHIRAWAVRLLTDGLTEINTQTLYRLLELAAEDTSGLVRLYLASSLGRLSGSVRLKVSKLLCAHESDANDRVQPHLIWYGIEPAVVNHWTDALELAAHSRIPLVSQNIVRRLTQEIESRPEIANEILQRIIADNLDAENSLQGMHLALEGRNQVPVPANWQLIVKKFSATEQQSARHLISDIGIIFGDGRAIEDLKQIVTSNSAELTVRRRAIESWAKTKPDDMVDVLRKLVGNRSFTTAAVRGLVHSDDPNVAPIIIRQMPHMDPEGRLASINTLVSREPWALKLLNAAEKGRIAKDEITAYHARQMFQLESAQVNSRLEQVWGRILSTPAETKREIDSLRRSLVDSDGNYVDFDVKAGRKLFEKNCAACHVMYGEGGNTGPDLTGSNRSNLNYLLDNIINPSGSVAETYRSSVIALEDGRIISGLILTRDDQTVRMQTPDEVINVDTDLIEAIRESDKSVMPDGLLTNMSLKQKADLLGYLMTQNSAVLDE